MCRGPRASLGLKNQQDIARSKELLFAIKQVEEIANEGNHITHKLSHADLLQLGGYAAVEYCGGPAMVFRAGRKDLTDEGDAVQHEAETTGGSLVVQRLAQHNLTSEEFVALMGSFTIGFIGENRKGPSCRWTMNPYVFDNSYFKELLLRDESKYIKTEADLRLLQQSELKNWVEAYAQDEDLFFTNYAKAHVKVSELAVEDQLVSEFEADRIIDGGYQERSRYQLFANWFRNEDEDATVICRRGN